MVKQIRRTHQLKTIARPKRKAWDKNCHYGLDAWMRMRKAWLLEHPLCVMCEAKGELTPATIVDHVVPHRGDSTLFWTGELQSLCKRCHDSDKQRIENHRLDWG